MGTPLQSLQTIQAFLTTRDSTVVRNTSMYAVGSQNTTVFVHAATQEPALYVADNHTVSVWKCKLLLYMEQFEKYVTVLSCPSLIIPYNSTEPN